MSRAHAGCMRRPTDERRYMDPPKVRPAASKRRGPAVGGRPPSQCQDLFGFRFSGSSEGHARAMTLRTWQWPPPRWPSRFRQSLAAAGPTVTVVSKSPLQLRGVSFRPGIVVTVTVATRAGADRQEASHERGRQVHGAIRCRGRCVQRRERSDRLDQIRLSTRSPARPRGRAPRSSLSTSSGSRRSALAHGRAAQPCGFAIAW